MSDGCLQESVAQKKFRILQVHNFYQISGGEDTAFCLLKPGKGRMTIEKLKTVGLFQPKDLKWAVA